MNFLSTVFIVDFVGFAAVRGLGFVGFGKAVGGFYRGTDLWCSVVNNRGNGRYTL